VAAASAIFSASSGQRDDPPWHLICSPVAIIDMSSPSVSGGWKAMMKQLLFVGALAAAVGTVGVRAQDAAGHTAPKQQPTTAPDAAVPGGEMALGTVRIAKAVKADGKPLAAGTYQLRLTGQEAAPNALGQTEAAERWVEFVRGGKVVGREVVTIVPQAEIGLVQKDTPPARNAAKVETLRGGDYVRVWINRGGNHYLIHLPV
jgi:hypothetical protein